MSDASLPALLGPFSREMIEATCPMENPQGAGGNPIGYTRPVDTRAKGRWTSRFPAFRTCHPTLRVITVPGGLSEIPLFRRLSTDASKRTVVLVLPLLVLAVAPSFFTADWWPRLQSRRCPLRLDRGRAPWRTAITRTIIVLFGDMLTRVLCDLSAVLLLAGGRFV